MPCYVPANGAARRPVTALLRVPLDDAPPLHLRQRAWPTISAQHDVDHLVISPVHLDPNALGITGHALDVPRGLPDRQLRLERDYRDFECAPLAGPPRP